MLTPTGPKQEQLYNTPKEMESNAHSPIQFT